MHKVLTVLGDNLFGERGYSQKPPKGRGTDSWGNEFFRFKINFIFKFPAGAAAPAGGESNFGSRGIITSFHDPCACLALENLVYLGLNHDKSYLAVYRNVVYSLG